MPLRMTYCLIVIAVFLTSLPAMAMEYTTRDFENGSAWHIYPTEIPVAFHWISRKQRLARDTASELKGGYHSFVVLMPHEPTPADVQAIRDSMEIVFEIAPPRCKEAGFKACWYPTNGATFVVMLDSTEVSEETGIAPEDDRLAIGTFHIRTGYNIINQEEYRNIEIIFDKDELTDQATHLFLFEKDPNYLEKRKESEKRIREIRQKYGLEPQR